MKIQYPLLIEAVKDLLISLDETEEGMALLKILKTSQFDDFQSEEGKTLARIKELYDIVTSKR